MPVGAKILSVQAQHNKPTIWALVDPVADKETRRFFVVGTGWPIDPDRLAKSEFCGSVQIGAFVWHVFEERL
jgi:hypothetical protein